MRLGPSPIETTISTVHLSPTPASMPDPDDEMVLEAAINGHADALVTYVAAHFRNAAARFGLRLRRPVEIVREVVGS